MKYFIFRNTTIERFFQHVNANFSGYEDISIIDDHADRYIWFYLSPIIENSIIAEKIHYYMDLVQLVAEHISSEKMFIVLTIKNIFSIDNISSDRTISDAVNDYNESIYILASKYKNIKVIDFTRFLDTYASDELIDWKYYFMAQIGLNPRLTVDFQEWFTTQIQAIELKRKKCLVLDLDNILWGGVLGEDGTEGIDLGGDYPGKVFLIFQHQLLELSRQGIILTVNSKNNIEDVREVWNKHPDIVLKEEHFAALRINWNNKADNIREMAQELNIGLDSMVFLDDNPAERELVKNYLPEVIVPDFPGQPYMLLNFFKKVTEQYFSIYALTEEDKIKTEQYKANILRVDTRQAFTNMEEYIRSLEIVLKIAEVNDLTIFRAAQMTQKTNQFNLTTRRYTDTDIRNMLNKGNRIFTLSVSDKFGDNGITGICIIKIIKNKEHIDSLLLSCRILGKGIERVFIEYILKKLRIEGITEITASYIPTGKNSQVADFYEKIGFILENEDKKHVKYYWADLSKMIIEPSKNYKLLKEDII
jgi:FkbH-like protein